MVGKSFENGDLVWAKMKGFPYWPAEILPCPPGSSAKKSTHYVHFFTASTSNCAWIADELIKFHSEGMMKTLPKKVSKDLQLAIDHINDLAARKGHEKVEKMDQSDSDEDVGVAPLLSTTTFKRKATTSFVRRNGKIVKASTSASTEKPNVKIATPKKLSIKATIPKKSTSKSGTPKTLRVKITKPETKPKKKKRIIVENDEGERTTISRQAIYKSETPLTRPPQIRSFTEPTPLKIGVLGLGHMGRCIVLNLLATGHHVTVWNRTAEKCDAMVAAGAIRAEKPADAVLACDVIFGCLADSNAVKSVMFSQRGVLKGIEEKGEEADFGYIEMTSIDDEFAQEMSECVTLSGGRYLEAPMIGTRQDAERGELLIISSGNPDLFESCTSCFHALSKDVLFVSSHVGEATQLRLIYSSFNGMVYAGLAESLAMCERVNVKQTDFLEAVQCRQVLSSALANKGHQMIQKRYLPAGIPLKHQQRDMALVLGLAERLYLNSPIARFTNAIYTHTKRLGYGEHDSTAAYHGVKF